MRSFHCFTRPRMVREPQAQPAPSTRPPARRHTTASRATCAPAGPLLPALAGSSLRPCWGQGWLCRGQLARARSRVCASRGRVRVESRGLTQVSASRVCVWSEVAVLVLRLKVLVRFRSGWPPDARAARRRRSGGPPPPSLRLVVRFITSTSVLATRGRPRPAPRRAPSRSSSWASGVGHARHTSDVARDHFTLA